MLSFWNVISALLMLLFNIIRGILTISNNDQQHFLHSLISLRFFKNHCHCNQMYYTISTMIQFIQESKWKNFSQNTWNYIIASVKKFNEELIRCFIQQRHAIEWNQVLFFLCSVCSTSNRKSRNLLFCFSCW